MLGKLKLIGFMVLVLVGCAGDDAGGSDAESAEPTELESNRRTWNEAGVEDYVYTYSNYSNAPEPAETVVLVMQSDVVAAYDKHSGAEYAGNELSQLYAISDFFDLVDAKSEDPEIDEVRVISYNEFFGFPEHVVVDYDKQTADEEYNYRIADLQPATTLTAVTYEAIRCPADGSGDGSLKQPRQEVIRDNHALRDFYYFAEPNSQEPVPEIDFDSQMALAVHIGHKPTLEYGVEIVRVYETDEKLLVHYQSLVPSDGCLQHDAVSHPYCIVSIDRSNKTVQFVESLVEHCPTSVFGTNEHMSVEPKSSKN